MYLQHFCHFQPSPKNHYSNDICIYKDTPIVVTSKSDITHIGKDKPLDSIKNEMMSIRWKAFKFYKQIAQSDQVDFIPYSKCFAKLVIEGTE